MPAKLDKKALSTLLKGSSAIAMVACESGSVTFSNLDFTNADLIYSIKGSLEVNQEDGSETDVNIDQESAPIDTDKEVGSITISANYPTIAEAAFESFYKAGKAIASLKSCVSTETYKGKSFFNEPLEKECSLLLRSKDGNTGFVFARVKLSVKMVYKSDGTPFYLALTGKVLTNLAAGEGDFAPLVKNAA